MSDGDLLQRVNKVHDGMLNNPAYPVPPVDRFGGVQGRAFFACRFAGEFFRARVSSWLNLVERWFRELTEKAIRRGSFLSVPDLKHAIEEFMHAWNENPKPFMWTATVEDIIKKIDRARAKAEQIKPGSTLPRGKKKVVNL